MKETLKEVVLLNVNTGKRVTIKLWREKISENDKEFCLWWTSMEVKGQVSDDGRDYALALYHNGEREQELRESAYKAFYERVNLNVKQDGYIIEYIG